MNTAKLKLSARAVVLLALVAAIVWQQRRVQHLVAETDALQQQADQAATLRDENQRLTEQLRSALDRSRADASELARLRGQSARMRQMVQDNARLRAEGERLSKPPRPSSSAISDDQTPEWKLVETRMRFTKVLGLSILSFASDNKWQTPADLVAAISSQTVAAILADQLPLEAANHELRIDQFELVFQGNVRSTGRKPGTTMLARAKQPVKLSNGRWARAAVFDDGHAEVIVADTLEALAAREKTSMHGQIAQ